MHMNLIPRTLQKKLMEQKGKTSLENMLTLNFSTCTGLKDTNILYLFFVVFNVLKTSL